MPDPDPYRHHRYLRTRDVRQYLGGISLGKLRSLRRRSRFPEPIDIGGLHVYDKQAVDEWMDEQRGRG
jgi:predicted DNA-binding transcriptional regulator AlpA